MARTRRTSPWLVMVGVVTFLAGLLFGYDQGVISGALQFIGDDFDLGDVAEEVITSWVTLGALFGALVAGAVADRVGRRRTLVLAAALFVVGAVGQAASPGPVVLVAFRLVVGVGVGVASVAAPLYAAEMAPAAVRGRFVSTYQLAITVGIFVAELVDRGLADDGDWRLMLGLSLVPGIGLALAVWPMTDTPRWLVAHGQEDGARHALERLRPPAPPPAAPGVAGFAEAPPAVQEPSTVDAALDEIRTEVATEETAAWGEVVAPRNRRALWAGVGLAVFQQITGINAVIYYADQIFADAGFTSPAAQADATLFGVGAVNVLATFVAIAFVDRLGRRPLLLAGLVGMGVSLAGLGAAFLRLDAGDASGIGQPSTLGILTLVLLMVYIASFAFSLGPVVWTVISEIYPSRIRGRAVAVATAVNWGSAFLVSQTFLTLFDDLGPSVTFWLFAVACVAGYLWIRRAVPETRGRTLEQIERAWHADVDPGTSEPSEVTGR